MLSAQQPTTEVLISKFLTNTFVCGTKAELMSVMDTVSCQLLEANSVTNSFVELPFTHTSSDGFYTRIGTYKKNQLVFGRAHKKAAMNFLIKGSLLLMRSEEEGGWTVLKAPLAFTTPGKGDRKLGYFLEDSIFVNTFSIDWEDENPLLACSVIDDEIVSNFYVDDSEKVKEIMYKAFMKERGSSKAIACREDFALFCSESGVTLKEHRDEYLKCEVTPVTFQMPMIELRDSPIEGKGVFTTASLEEGEAVVPYCMKEGQILFGERYVNHASARYANTFPRLADDGIIYLIANKQLLGSKGGVGGSEVLVDYRDLERLLLKLTLSGKEGKGDK